MRQKHIPTRTCVGCRTTRPKRELIRIVRTPTEAIEVDRTGKKAGRGAYICPSTACLERAVQGQQLERSFKCKVDTAVKEELVRDFHADHN